MSVSGLCQVCESNAAEESCERCGALVCERHYDGEHAMCVSCVAETTRGDRDDRGDRGRRFHEQDVPGEHRF
ncbi:hypothetical protein [Halorubellus sp. PRR65]|uniref:hypothetical protein n=1 Tax=Halorubellus sp. PRR65 TaxID=3098148 RepID=UPI002B257138|nr:hypothetical protein [Halorubellus sp. PRR65]